MISIEIPGWGNLEIENVVCDLNGTLATDGKLISGVKEQIHLLSEKVKIYVLTADTHGTAAAEVQELKAELIKVSEKSGRHGKLKFLHSLGPELTVVVGNGNNDQLILKESSLGIAVLGREGSALAAIRNADVLVAEITDAFDLLLKPNRLIATLRE